MNKTIEPGAEIIRLKGEIRLLIVTLDNTNILPQPRLEWMVDGLTDLILAAVTKFIEGQLEHGDNFEEVHGPTEALKEFIDTFFYLRKCTHPINLYEQNNTNT